MGTVRRATPHLLLAVWVAACGADNAPAPAPGAEAVAPAAPDGEWFVDRAAEAGLDFVHFNGMTGEFYQPEMAGPGAGLFDYDNDGDLDVYLVQGELLGDGDPLLAPPADHPPGDRLFRNDLEIADDGKRTLRFTDVTEAAGIAARGYGMGVAAGDVDNDGWVDLYLTRFGRNRMLRNQGDGTFVDVTSRSGTGDPAWGVPASFFDYDRDGWLDLFVGNYLSYTLESHTQCYDRAGAPDYCPPETSRPHPNVLYRNRGDGTFEDVTAAAGLGREFGPAFGAATADFDGDGRLDLFVANDQRENQLWMNQGDGTFRNRALAAGAALGAGGNAKADMGVDAGDFDNDGDEDLFITEPVRAGQHPLCERRRRPVPRAERRTRHPCAESAVHRLRGRVDRHRQRRLAGRDRRERRGRSELRDLRPEGQPVHAGPAQPGVPQSRRDRLRGGDRPRGGGLRAVGGEPRRGVRRRRQRRRHRRAGGQRGRTRAAAHQSAHRQPAPLARAAAGRGGDGIQHELIPRVSLNVGWYRRVFSDIEQRSNEALLACDTSTAVAGVPCGSWIPFAVSFDDPNGRVATLRGLGQNLNIDTTPFLAYDLDPAYRGLVNNLDVTSAINRNYYNGFEVSLNARLPNGGNIFGGWTAHQHIQDTCGLTANPNGIGIEDPIRGADENILRGGRFCNQSELGLPFRNDFKLFGAYPLPGDFEFSGSIQAYAGGEREMRWGIPSSYFPGGVRTQGATVQVFAPGTNYYDYWTQVDIAFRKILRFGGLESSVQADVYNLMNSAVVVDENDSYGGSFARPTRLLQGRLLRMAFQVKW